MSEQLTIVEDRLIESLALAKRGARRNGTYALWLFVRTCGGLLPPDRLSDRLAGATDVSDWDEGVPIRAATSAALPALTQSQSPGTETRGHASDLTVRLAVN